MSAPDNELYVGYAPYAPRETARFLRRIVAAAVAAALAAAVAVAARHTRLARSVFEYGIVRDVEGTVLERPQPMLLVARPGDNGTGESHSRYLLVGQGKRGCHELVAGMDGRRVTLSGSLVYRDGATMIEVVAGSVVAEVSGERVEPLPDERLGPVTLAGEIVDAKCYLGVMNPGAGKTHRDCAVRCISGGSPPLFVARDDEGRLLFYLLVGPDGESINREVLDRVGETVVVEGVAVRSGDMLVLRAAAGAIVTRALFGRAPKENHDAE